ncbi:hypothetical protein MIR68_002260 [Amoeboaphelidium protococcarum]|nr:hypothetical protein MIR68_002260 [Amoeboaphelidium protococcarum]
MKSSLQFLSESSAQLDQHHARDTMLQSQSSLNSQPISTQAQEDYQQRWRNSISKVKSINTELKQLQELINQIKQAVRSKYPLQFEKALEQIPRVVQSDEEDD